jgi:hypothetical protein
MADFKVNLAIASIRHRIRFLQGTGGYSGRCFPTITRWRPKPKHINLENTELALSSSLPFGGKSQERRSSSDIQSKIDMLIKGQRPNDSSHSSFNTLII